MTSKLPLAGLMPLVVAMAAASCSSAERRPDAPIVADLSPDEEVICRRYRPVGTHIPVQVCRTRAEIEAAREAALRSVGPLRPMSGGERPMGGDDRMRPPN